MDLPSYVQTLIVGGGIAGCSTAYHLTRLGRRDVLLLEQGRLTSGTTWHAAGLVGQMRPNRSMTQMSRYGIDLYAGLEAETGLATGWKRCGSVNVARTPERWQLLHKQAALARSFGVEVQLVSPREAGELFPLMRTDDLQGAIWIPGDGKANPTDLTMSLAKGARQGGATLAEGVQVTGVIIETGPRGTDRIAGVRTLQAGVAGEIRCETLINCAGQWARQFGALAGVNVPLCSAEHFYIVTRQIPGVAPDLPVIRDPDGCIYYKEEVGGLVMGGFEPHAKPWNPETIPDHFEFQLLPEDWDQFEVLMTNAIHRTPCLETAEVKLLLNGPESFTGDGNFILGEAPELAGYFVCAGFNSAGIANSGGAGKLVAEWIVNGEPPLDLWDVDIRRFAPFHANRRHLADRTVESLGLHYAMRWPREELKTVRPLRRSPLYDTLRAKGAVFGSRMGWERANYFLPPGAALPPPTLGTPGWLPWVLEEQRACREDVVVFDQTSFSKFLLKGRDALDVLQRLCANEIDVAPGRMVYTAMLNARGGFESDVTVIRTGAQEFFIVSGSAQTTRDFAWIERGIRDGEHAALVDVGSAYSVLSVMGPKAEALLRDLTVDDISRAAMPFSTTREIDVGYARLRAARMSYVGGPGYELYVTTDQCATLYEALWSAGARHGLRDAGYYTIDALRVEAGRRAWGAELSPDETPWEAGLGYAVRMDKPAAFTGREALLAHPSAAARKRLVLFTFDDERAFPWGGEPVLMDGRNVGELTSAGYSRKYGRAVAMGYARADRALSDEAILAARYEVDIAGQRFAVTPQLKLA